MRSLPLLLLVFPFSAAAADVVFQSRHLRLEMDPQRPAFQFLSVDSLGKGKLATNLLRPLPPAASRLPARRTARGVEYGDPKAPAWSIELSPRRLRLSSSYSRMAPPSPLVLEFDQRHCHATLLGHMNDNGSVRPPALLHLPDYGTFRVQGSPGAPAVGFDASREHGDRWVRITFPPASPLSPRVEWSLEVVTIYPELAAHSGDPRFDGYRRNFLNIFQLNPRARALANHASSDVCAFTLHQCAEMARCTPPLASGLHATDLVRATLIRFFADMKGYGLRGYLNPPPDKGAFPYDSLDTFPSLVWSAAACVESTRDLDWLYRSYPGIEAWAGRILSADVDGDGLIESPLSGNSGSWPPQILLRPANWWDTIGFGHKDAYSNALAFRALRGMAGLARAAGRADAERCSTAAERIRQAFPAVFFNPATGVLAGWKSADGRLHDYYFTFIAGPAVSLRLVPEEMAHRVMDRMLAKMREVGYTDFRLGLPGNLVPVRREDYLEPKKRYGGPELEDGSDGFQNYLNGGASACHAYWFIKGLYELERRADAGRILFPLLSAFEEGAFQGFAENGMSKDWKRWDGTPGGYEGFLADNYFALLMVHTGYAGIKDSPWAESREDRQPASRRDRTRSTPDKR